jgi:Holliday junction DNA helicase RuvA
MISRLRGTPVGRTPDGLVLDVGGVGYLVAATPSVLGRADGANELVVETYLHVREDTLQLYGFSDGGERELFVRLLGVSGIGPKVALAVVSSGPADDLRRAVVRGDAARFQVIPGIGKKTAERIVLELKGSIADAVGPSPESSGAPELVARDALVELGYSVVEAERVLASVDAGLSPEERVREALRNAA